ncbi:hypothetical protein BESB_050600 [Besnoitia besnoiti]|uniref:Cyclin2 related protein n=1 Tax=Besnoitia besnoiti TaxID=94643 RepID=A0A2A9MEC3_BESBE|nr:hypothetical protein BESB_050600 [Besnoitia besnoiti]PFH36868.1 hypothetical protein BESB_050600 [Besnoitia besnoiti]
MAYHDGRVSAGGAANQAPVSSQCGGYSREQNYTSVSSYDRQMGAEACSTDDSFVPYLATVLQHLVSISPPGLGEITSFHAIKEPQISIHDYLDRIAKYFGCSNECFVLSLVYIDRIIKLHRDFNVSILNIHRLLITSVMLAAKFFDDVYYSNKHYARVGGVRTREMNLLETQFLTLINYHLYVSPQEYDQYRRNVLAAVQYARHLSPSPLSSNRHSPSSPAAALPSSNSPHPATSEGNCALVASPSHGSGPAACHAAVAGFPREGTGGAAGQAGSRAGGVRSRGEEVLGAAEGARAAAQTQHAAVLRESRGGLRTSSSGALLSDRDSCYSQDEARQPHHRSSHSCTPALHGERGGEDRRAPPRGGAEAAWVAAAARHEGGREGSPSGCCEEEVVMMSVRRGSQPTGLRGGRGGVEAYREVEDERHGEDAVFTEEGAIYAERTQPWVECGEEDGDEDDVAGDAYSGMAVAMAAGDEESFHVHHHHHAAQRPRHVADEEEWEGDGGAPSIAEEKKDSHEKAALSPAGRHVSGAAYGHMVHASAHRFVGENGGSGAEAGSGDSVHRPASKCGDCCSSSSTTAASSAAALAHPYRATSSSPPGTAPAAAFVSVSNASASALPASAPAGFTYVRGTTGTAAALASPGVEGGVAQQARKSVSSVAPSRAPHYVASGCGADGASTASSGGSSCATTQSCVSSCVTPHSMNSSPDVCMDELAGDGAGGSGGGRGVCGFVGSGARNGACPLASRRRGTNAPRGSGTPRSALTDGEACSRSENTRRRSHHETTNADDDESESMRKHHESSQHWPRASILGGSNGFAAPSSLHPASTAVAARQQGGGGAPFAVVGASAAPLGSFASGASRGVCSRGS